MKHHLTRFARHVMFWTLLTMAGGMIGVHFLFASIDNYKAALETQLSQAIDAPVKIGQLRAKLRGLTPEVRLLQLNIAAEKIQLNEIRLAIDTWELIKQRDFLAATTVTLIGAKITFIRHIDDTIGIEGLKASEGETLWLFQGRKYQILQSSVIWRDEKTNTAPRHISPVNIAIMNNDDLHRINVLAQLPQQIEPLRVSMILKGDALDPKKLDGSIFVEAKKINLLEFSELPLPLSLNMTKGHANFQVFANWKQGQLSDIHGRVSATQMTLTRPQRTNLNINRLSSTFQIQHDNEVWRVALPTLQFTLPETSVNGAIAVSINENDGQQNSMALNLAEMELAPLSLVANFFAPDKTLISLNQSKFSGALKNIRLFTQPALQKFAIHSELNDLSFYDVASKLHIEHINGFVHGSEQTGIVELNSNNVEASIPSLFREAFPTGQLNSTFHWQQLSNAWIFSSDSIALSNKDVQSDSRVKFTLSKNGANFIDLQTRFSADDATQTFRYLPVSVMGKEVVAWLDRAFEKGQLKNGQFLLYGNPSQFPFEKNQGVFEVLFDAKDTQLFYAPNWPSLTNLNGSVRFFQDSLQVNLEGMAQNAVIKTAEVLIPSMSTSHYVSVNGKLDGAVMDVLNFMRNTPLHTSFDNVLNAVTPQGNTQVDLDLQIPLEDKFLPKVKGSAQFHQAKLKVKSLNLPVSSLSGVLKFTEDGVFSDIIHGVAFKKPINITLANYDKQTTVEVSGNVEIEDVFSQLRLSSLPSAPQQKSWIEGASDYQLTLNLPKDQKASTLQIKSNLEGITLNLPDELFKAKGQKTPLNMVFTLGDDLWLPLMVDYNAQLKAALMVDTKNKRFQRGEVLLGEGKVEVPQSEGLTVKIVRDHLMLQDWLQLAVSKVPSSIEKVENTAATIHTFTMHSDHAWWKKASLGKFDLVLKHDAPSWRGVIDSDFAKGQLQWVIPEKTTQTGTLRLTLEKFDLAFFKQLQSTSESNSPSVSSMTNFMNLPTLFLESQRTFWKDCELGKLNIETETRASSIGFKTITLQAPTHNLKLTGDWFNAPILQTELRGRLTLLKAGQLFSHLGITKDISETTGDININLDWQGSPQQFSLEKMHGQAELNLKDGRILSIEPGFGRILGMLAVEQWLKRLSLDFSDLYQEGLAFNTVSGHFDFLQGKATTQNLMVDAIPAKILLKGDTDFLAENVNYLVNVTPKSADAVPIAGTIIGKIMNLVGQTLTGKDQEGFFFGSQYQITGSWGNTQVIALHENEGLMQKTWGQLTQFPWLHQQLNSKEAYHE
ncbi:MAG: hypothetical protein RLZZ384_424 [Pseudomonadota bacterium]